MIHIMHGDGERADKTTHQVVINTANVIRKNVLYREQCVTFFFCFMAIYPMIQHIIMNIFKQ